MFKLAGFALVIAWFWYFYYEDQTQVAFGMLLTACFLLYRELTQLLRERQSRTGRRRARFQRTEITSDDMGQP